MSYVFVVLTLCATLAAGSVALVQGALFGTSNAVVEVAFYQGNPAHQATSSATVTMNNSPPNLFLLDIDGATYATVVHEGRPYTFTWPPAVTIRAPLSAPPIRLPSHDVAGRDARRSGGGPDAARSVRRTVVTENE